MTGKAPSKATAGEVRDLIEAIRSARFALHCAHLGYKAKDDWEGVEVSSEVLVELAQAVAPLDPDQVACRGCANSSKLYGPARELVVP